MISIISRELIQLNTLEIIDESNQDKESNQGMESRKTRSSDNPFRFQSSVTLPHPPLEYGKPTEEAEHM